MRADRIEIPASITVVGFYKKQGYFYKDGFNELDVWAFNESAIEFYSAVGFHETRKWMEFEVK